MSQYIYLIRHGETDWNLEGRAQGRREVPLNETGREQAKVVGEFLDRFQLTSLISSDQSRAMETAEIIGRACGLSVRSESAFRERDLGPFEGKTLAEIQIERHNDLATWEGIPGVEQDESVLRRVLPALYDAAHRESGDVAIVTHGGVMKVIFNHIMEVQNRSRRFILHNGLVIILLWNGEQFYLDGMLSPHWMKSVGHVNNRWSSET